MSKYVIIGAGLGGLYTAHRLINKGISPKDILVIDPRAGRYTRPGHLHKQEFQTIAAKTG